MDYGVSVRGLFISAINTPGEPQLKYYEKWTTIRDSFDVTIYAQ